MKIRACRLAMNRPSGIAEAGKPFSAYIEAMCLSRTFNPLKSCWTTFVCLTSRPANYHVFLVSSLAIGWLVILLSLRDPFLDCAVIIFSSSAVSKMFLVTSYSYHDKRWPNRSNTCCLVRRKQWNKLVESPAYSCIFRGTTLELPTLPSKIH